MSEHLFILILKKNSPYSYLHCLLLVNRCAPNKTVQVQVNGLLFFPKNSRAFVFDVRGSIVAKLGAGTYDLNRFISTNNLLFIKVLGETQQVLKYGWVGH